MKSTAAGLAALGRGNDSVLVHMTPGEVSGLQQLAMAHGGSLTINPHTGLPEAGFLETILPMALGFALGPAGFALMSAPMAGLAVGGLHGLATGFKNPLGSVMAGLGGYGGAGLGEALGASGALEGIGLTSPSITTPPVPGNEFLQSGIPNVTDMAASRLYGGTQLANPAIVPPSPAGIGVAEAVSEMGTAGSPYARLPEALGGETVPTGMSLTTPPSPQMTMTPDTTRPTFMQALGQQFDTTPKKLAAGIGAIGALGGFEQPQLNFGAPQQPTSTARLSGPIRRPYDPTAPGGYYYTDRGILQPTYAAKGGEMHSVPQLEDGGFVLTKKAVDGMGKGSNERGQRAAAAGLGAIPIKGPGTGTSDSIPTSIDGVRPAKVSNGEAYVPQRRVKQAGGAKKLYALMRQAENDARRRAA